MDFAFFSAAMLTVLSAAATSLLYVRGRQRAAYWTMCLCDAVSLGVIIHFAGGADGPFTPLLLIHVLFAGIALGTGGGSYAAVTDTLLLGLSGFLTINGMSAEVGSQVLRQLGFQASSKLSVQYILLRVLLHSLTLLAVGIVSGYFSELARTRAGRLQDALDALRANRAGSRDILENLSDGILVLDSEGRPVASNRAFRSMTGLGEDWEAGVASTGVYRLLRGCLASGGIPDSTDVVEGDSVLECRIGLFRGSVGGSPGIMAVLTDVTEVRLLRSRLEEREKLAVIGRLSATMAHEIRNPLASISGAAQVLREGGLGPGESDRMAGMIIGQARRASDIIEGYLELARGGAGREDSDISLDALVTDVVESARASYAQDVPLELDAAQGVVVRGRRHRLQQMLDNLLRNACEALEGVRDPLVRVSVASDGGRASLSVSDNGPGMTPEELARATEPFFTTRDLGTGLGLYVARRVAEEHDGMISFQGGEAGGLVVRVDLPAAGG